MTTTKTTNIKTPLAIGIARAGAVRCGIRYRFTALDGRRYHASERDLRELGQWLLSEASSLEGRVDAYLGWCTWMELLERSRRA